MNGAQLVKLTAYFGERMRGERGFLADELVELFDREAVANSVVLRGIGGYGPSHQLRTDRTLSMSEDLPVALVAVDTVDRITALTEPVLTAIRRGTVTLERASTAASDSGSAKLTLYLGRRTRIAGRPAYRMVCDVLHQHGCAGATAFLGVDGTDHGARRRARFFSGNAKVPVLIEATGPADRLATALPRLRELLPAAMITVERVQVCKRDGQVLARPASVPDTDADGVPLWQKLTIHTSEATRHGAVPIHRAVLSALSSERAAGGVTVLRGIWGFHGDHEPHGDRLLQLGRAVPVATVIVDSPARIASCFDLIDELTGRHGLVTTEIVPAMVSIDGGVRDRAAVLAQPPD